MRVHTCTFERENHPLLVARIGVTCTLCEESALPLPPDWLLVHVSSGARDQEAPHASGGHGQEEKRRYWPLIQACFMHSINIILTLIS